MFAIPFILIFVCVSSSGQQENAEFGMAHGDIAPLHEACILVFFKLLRIVLRKQARRDNTRYVVSV